MAGKYKQKDKSPRGEQKQGETYAAHAVDQKGATNFQEKKAALFSRFPTEQQREVEDYDPCHDEEPNEELAVDIAVPATLLVRWRRLLAQHLDHRADQVGERDALQDARDAQLRKNVVVGETAALCRDKKEQG